MTKNEDVSWIPKPVRCSSFGCLKRFTTDELVAELKGRHELCPVVDEMTREPVCLFVMTTESLVKELSKRNGVEYADIECEDGIAKTIVIHGWKE